MQRAPLLIPAVALLLGILCEQHGLGPPLAIISAAVALIRRDAALGALLGLALGMAHGHPSIVADTRRTSRYLGTVIGDVRPEAGSTQFPLAVDGIGTLRATSRATVRAGERLLVRARIEPLDDARNPGEPSPRLLALDDGIIGEIVIGSVLARAAPDVRDPRIWPALLRERASRIVRSSLPEPAATLLAGALWGERGTLPQDVRDDFQTTGTVHVLVTAGLHLGIVAALLAGLLGALRVPRITASLAAIPVIYGYAWVSGWHLPAQRAAAMIAVGLTARACGARALSLNTLALAAMIVAAAWPVALQSISFALSFSCVTAIVLFASPIAHWFEDRRVPGVIAEALALTISTQVGVWPLTAAVFGVAAPYAIVANAVVVPLVALTMCVGLATLVSHPMLALSSVFARWDLWLLTLILATNRVLAHLPGATLRLAPPPLWAIAAYDVAVLVAATKLRAHARAALATLLGACLIVILASLAPKETGVFSITMLDVGQGDGIVIQTPHGHTLLIDTGGRLERGRAIDGRSPAQRSAERIVLPYLGRSGVTRVDLMLLTHPHGDHVGGFAGIARTFSVGWVADSGQRYGGTAYNDGLREARLHHIPVIVPACHQRWTDDEVRLTFLTPCGPPFADGDNDVNENSLVVLVEYHALRVLFMGDAGFASEQRLLAQQVDLHADILKVGHHGSAYSSSEAFLNAVRPRLALISVGRHNPFGHPALSTLDHLLAVRSMILRTDRCGAITIRVNDPDHRLKINTMVPCSPQKGLSTLPTTSNDARQQRRQYVMRLQSGLGGQRCSFTERVACAHHGRQRDESAN